MADSTAVPMVATSGTATLSRMPDKATISFAIRGSNKTSHHPAARDVAERHATTLAALAAVSIPADKLETAGYDMGREPMLFRERSGLGPYYVEHSFNVEVSDITMVASVIEALRKGGATRIGPISYDISNASELQQALNADAVRNATERARLLAEAGGARLGRLITVGTPEAIAALISRHREFPQHLSHASMYRLLDSHGRGGEEEEEPTEPPPIDITPRPIQLHATVYASWALEPAEPST